MSRISTIAIVTVIFPSVCLASGSDGGYMVLGFLLCIPSFIAIGFLISFIIKCTKKPDFQLLKVWAICFVVLVPAGFSFTEYGALYPNWAAFIEHRYVRLFISAFILSFPLIGFYRIKWEQNGAKSEGKG